LLWLIFIGVFLTGFVFGRWALVLLIPLVLWIQRGPLDEGIELWLSLIAAAALMGGIVLRWFARHQRS
jgi:hypothetical protein